MKVHSTSSSFGATFLTVAMNAIFSGSSAQSQPLRRLALTRKYVGLLPSTFITIPSLLGALWNGTDGGHAWDGRLFAVPKKKTSHMKKRHRQMAGKALKDVTALNKCSACGRAKRAHVLCPHCVNSEDLP